MKKLTVCFGFLAAVLLPLAANAQSCTYHVIVRYHYTDANGSDHGCTVTQFADCSVWTACAG